MEMLKIMSNDPQTNQETLTHQGDRLNALYPVVTVDQPSVTAAAFQRLFAMEPVFETDWYVHLMSSNGARQVGFVRYDHESVPAADREPVKGAFLTMDSSDVAGLWEEVRDVLDIEVPLTDEAWGQRHFIGRLPGGVLVDVVQMLEQE